MKSPTAIAAILLLAFASAAPAADEPGAGSTRTGPSIELVDLLARVAKRTGKQFILDPRASTTVSTAGLDVNRVDYPRLLASYRAHMEALARFQDENGMWRNVVDRPGAYPEYSATAMIGAAMLRGVRNGWLDRTIYEPRVQAAWNGILTRTGADGRLVDVCESTGTRGLTDQDYLRRTAILGRDDRGGGMAMFFATELAGL